MKFLIVRMRKNGMCRCWTNGDHYDHAIMGAVAFSDGIDRVAKKEGKTWEEASRKFWRTVEKSIRGDGNK